EDPEETARHLALGAIGPERSVSDALEIATARARDRGASAAAADLADQAVALTPKDAEDDALLRRRLLAAECHFDAGNADAARALLEEASTNAPLGPARAEVLRRLGNVWRFQGKCDKSRDL